MKGKNVVINLVSIVSWGDKDLFKTLPIIKVQCYWLKPTKELKDI